MTRADYERPADYQVINHYKCRSCGSEQSVESCYSAAMPCPQCGGYVDRVGESYPASADDWDECRDTQDGEWRQKGQY